MNACEPTGEPAPPDSVWLRTRASLLARVKGSADAAAWSDFYDMYWRVTYTYAVRLGLSRDDAEDLVQEVFIKLLRKLPDFHYDRRKGRFLSWLKTITRNAVADFHRRRQARIEGGLRIEPDEDGNDPIDRLPDPRADPATDPWEEEWERSLLDRALERVKAQVKPANFEAFRLYALENRPAHEVAATLGVTRNTVFIAKNRILAMLQEEVRRLKSEVGA